VHYVQDAPLFLMYDGSNMGIRRHRLHGMIRSDDPTQLAADRSTSPRASSDDTSPKGQVAVVKVRRY